VTADLDTSTPPIPTPDRHVPDNSLLRKVRRATRARINRRVASTVSVERLSLDGPAITLADGESWGGLRVPDVPLDPQATGLCAASTATRPMRAWCVPNLLMAPRDGVALSPRLRRVVAESLNTGVESLNVGHDETLRRQRLSSVRPSTLAGNSSLLVSPGRNHYHSLVDNLARVCAFGLPELASERVDVYHGDRLTPVEQYVLDRLLPSNVTLRHRPQPELVRAERFVLPTFPAWRFSGWLPKWYLTALREAVLPDRPSHRSERIFIVRRGARLLKNEGDLLRRLQRFGIRPVDLEELTFPQQIELFYDADVVVAPHGAGLTNLLFADRALVVEIFSTAQVYPHYLMMCLSLGHDYRHVPGTRRTRWEDFDVDPAAIEDEVVAGLERRGGIS
jgi:capsular polysaccharide biosynthesis protein